MGRIDDHLEGEIGPAELTPEERAEAAAVRDAIEAAHTYITARPVPDLADGIMRHIEQHRLQPGTAARRSVRRRLLDALWMTRRVSFHLRPAYGLLGAAAMIALVVTAVVKAPLDANDSGIGEPRVFVQFRLDAVEATDVRLAGSFSNWQPEYQLHQAAPGIWTITVSLPPGVHDYAFVVDGERWVADPYAPRVSDGFGGANSRLALAPNGPRT